MFLTVFQAFSAAWGFRFVAFFHPSTGLFFQNIPFKIWIRPSTFTSATNWWFVDSDAILRRNLAKQLIWWHLKTLSMLHCFDISQLLLCRISLHQWYWPVLVLILFSFSKAPNVVVPNGHQPCSQVYLECGHPWTTFRKRCILSWRS